MARPGSVKDRLIATRNSRGEQTPRTGRTNSAEGSSIESRHRVNTKDSVGSDITEMIETNTTLLFTTTVLWKSWRIKNPGNQKPDHQNGWGTQAYM